MQILTKIWSRCLCWARYLVAETDGGVKELVAFVIGNHFFYALQQPEELAALGRCFTAGVPSALWKSGRPMEALCSF